MGHREPDSVPCLMMLGVGEGSREGQRRGWLYQNKDTAYCAFFLKALDTLAENMCMCIMPGWTAVTSLHTAICIHVFLMDRLGLSTYKQKLGKVLNPGQQCWILAPRPFSSRTHYSSKNYYKSKSHDITRKTLNLTSHIHKHSHDNGWVCENLQGSCSAHWTWFGLILITCEFPSLTAMWSFGYYGKLIRLMWQIATRVVHIGP